MTELELLREELKFKDEKIAFLEMQLTELRWNKVGPAVEPLLDPGFHPPPYFPPSALPTPPSWEWQAQQLNPEGKLIEKK